MPDVWTFEVYDDTTKVADLHDAWDRSVTWRLVAAGEASFKLDGTSDAAPHIRELVSDLLVRRNGEPWWRGRIGARQDLIGANGHEITYSAVDYRGVLSRHFTRTNASWTGSSPVDMAWELLTQPISVAGRLGITRGAIHPMPNRPFDVEWGTAMDKAIESLALIYPGFTWWVDAERRFQTAWRGTVRSWPLRFGETVDEANRTFDPAHYANVIRASGAEGTPRRNATVPDLAGRPEGAWEAVVTDTDLLTAEAVQNLADGELMRRSTLAPDWTHQVTPGTWTPDDAWIGDMVPIQVRSGPLDVDTLDRITEITVTPGDDIEPDVEIVTGSELRRDLAVMLRDYGHQLTALARR